MYILLMTSKRVTAVVDEGEGRQAELMTSFAGADYFPAVNGFTPVTASVDADSAPRPDSDSE